MSDANFVLPPSLTHDDAHAVSAAIAQALAQAQSEMTGTERCLRLDAHAVSHIDTAALAVVLQAQRDAKAQGWTVTVTPIPPRLLQLAQMYGVNELLGWSN